MNWRILLTSAMLVLTACNAAPQEGEATVGAEEPATSFPDDAAAMPEPAPPPPSPNPSPPPPPPAAVEAPPSVRPPGNLPGIRPGIRPQPGSDSGAIVGGPATDDATSAVDGAAASAQEPLIWCAVVEEKRTAADCALLQQVEIGAASFRAPERMLTGETRTVRLALSRSGDIEATKDSVGSGPGQVETYRTAVGRFVEATLRGDAGLTVVPDSDTPAIQDLGASDSGNWSWRVTADREGDHELAVRVRVMSRQPDGSFLPRGRTLDDVRVVKVDVSEADQRKRDDDRRLERVGFFNRWLTALAAPTESLTNLLTLLGSLVAALGALWVAIRSFGRRNKADKPAKGDGAGSTGTATGRDRDPDDGSDGGGDGGSD